MSEPTWPPEGPWPSTPGGIRGPDGRTLTDLYNAVASTDPFEPGLAYYLNHIMSSLASIAGDTQRLAGWEADRPAGWVGLPHFLRRTVGDPQAVDTNRLRDLTATTVGRLNLLNTMLLNGGFSNTEEGELLLIARAVELALSGPDGLQARLLQLAQVAGELSAAPVGETLKSLLEQVRTEAQRQADCCEEGQTGEPGGPENPPPAGFCAGDGLRLASWQELGSTTVSGAPATIYRAVWNFSGGELAPFTGWAAPGPGEGEAVISLATDNRGGLCVSWDFTGGTAPLAIGRDLTTSDTAAWESTVLGTPALGGGSTLELGGLSDDVSTCSGGARRFVAWNFAFPEGVTPALNVFARIMAPIGCAS